jgi:hypothetical protein
VRACLCRAHADAAEAAVELVASELVTDSVRRGAPPIDLTVECQVSLVEVIVADRGQWLPRDETVDVDLSWVLVDKIARAWGIEPAASGRRLWCTVPTGQPPRATDRRRPRTVRVVAE